MATQLRAGASPSVPPIPAELEAMLRHWDAMADSLLNFATDDFERAKADFYGARARLVAGKAVML